MEIQPDREPSIPIRDSTPFTSSTDCQFETLPSSGPPEIQLNENKVNGTADQDLEAALQEAVRAEADSHEEGEVAEEMDIDDSYAPNPIQLAPESPPIQREDVNRSPSYSPVLERRMSNVTDPQSDADYEPPAAAPSVDPTPIQSPPFSPAPADPVARDANDLVIFPSDSGPLTTDDVEIVDSSLPQTNGDEPMLIEVKASQLDILFGR